MTEHQRETAFLRHIILFDNTAKGRELHERIAQVQRDARCAQRAASLLVLITALMAAGLAYGVILQDNFPYAGSQFVINVMSGLGLGSLISLVVLAGLWLVNRQKSNRLRQECRRLVRGLLASHLGQPRISSRRDSQVQSGEREVVQGAVELNGTVHRLDLLRELAVCAVNQPFPQKNSQAKQKKFVL